MKSQSFLIERKRKIGAAVSTPIFADISEF